jgi:hypothetical protein
LIQGNVDSDGLPTSGARLCLLKPENLCYQMPSNPGYSSSSFPILVTADFYWMDGETHFAKHSYTVSAYRFNVQTDRYAKAFSYRTSKKYPGLDEVDQVHVLGPERGEILRRLLP